LVAEWAAWRDAYWVVDSVACLVGTLVVQWGETSVVDLVGWLVGSLVVDSVACSVGSLVVDLVACLVGSLVVDLAVELADE